MKTETKQTTKLKIILTISGIIISTIGLISLFLDKNMAALICMLTYIFLRTIINSIRIDELEEK